MALSELIDGQIKFLWTAIGIVAVAQVAIVRAALDATGKRLGAKISAGFCAISIAVSYATGYLAATGLVTLVREAGESGIATTDAIRTKLEGEIKITLSTIEVFIGGQVAALVVAVFALAVSFLMNRDLIRGVLND